MRPCGNLSAYANVSLSYDILLLTHMPHMKECRNRFYRQCPNYRAKICICILIYSKYKIKVEDFLKSFILVLYTQIFVYATKTLHRGV